MPPRPQRKISNPDPKRTGRHGRDFFIFTSRASVTHKEMRRHFQSQDTFPALNVAEGKDDDWMDMLVEHEVFSGMIPTKCDQLRIDQESSNCDQEGFGAILDAWNAYISCEIERTQNEKATAERPTLPTTYSENVFEPLKHIKTAGPPKRFRRRGAMWKAITSRMMEQSGEPVAIQENVLC
jgi:hypothetical protein